MARTPSDDSDNQDRIMRHVERSMKKQTDDVMQFLEGLSLQLSQLELYCYNVDKSIGEMRVDLAQDHTESDAILNFLDKHLQEVHRSVQILRDKQELADTQKELAKLKNARKESSSSSHNSQQNDDHRASSTPDMRNSETHGQQLALQPLQGYYLPPGLTQYPQSPPQPQVQTFPHYQWTTQATVQPVSRPLSSPQVYPQYLPTKPPLREFPEPQPNSTPMQMTYSNSTIQVVTGPNQPVTTYSYGPPAQTTNPGYAAGGLPNAYVVYDNASGRVQHSSQGGQFYPSNPQQSGGGIDFDGVLDRLNGRGRGWSG